MGNSVSTDVPSSTNQGLSFKPSDQKQDGADHGQITGFSAQDVPRDVSVPPDLIHVSKRQPHSEKQASIWSDSEDEFEDAVDFLEAPPPAFQSPVTQFQQVQAAILGQLVAQVEELLIHLSNQSSGISPDQCQALLSSVSAVTQAYSAVTSSPDKLLHQTNQNPRLSIDLSDLVNSANERQASASPKEDNPASKGNNHKSGSSQKQSSEDSESGVDTTSFRGDSSERNDSPFPEHPTNCTLIDSGEVGADGKPRHTLSSSSSNTAWEIDVSSWGDGDKKARKKKLATRPILRSRFVNEAGATGDALPEMSPQIAHIAQRKTLDFRRWYCISRPQYKKSCGMSALVSCWNYLFSTLGHGKLPPLSQEEALTIAGLQPPFEEIRFGPFTGNLTLMRWFRKLNDHFAVKGRCFMLYKPRGKNQTTGMTSDLALESLKRGLQDNLSTYIYHCQNHYFCPIGFEDTLPKPEQAYGLEEGVADTETWILIGETSRKHPAIHCKRWEDISSDLNCENPDYLDIRCLDKGIRQRKTSKKGGNLHCIMTFQKNRQNESRISRSAGKTRPRSTGSVSPSTSQTRLHNGNGHLTEPAVSNHGNKDEAFSLDEDSDIESEEESE